MTSLLEIRERIKLIYSKNEFFILPVMKFLLAFVTLNVVNGQLGYMTTLDNVAVVLIVALLCSFMPKGCILFFAVLFSLLHMYKLSMEVALVGACIYLVMFLLFFRLSPKDVLVVLITPVLCVMRIPYVVPIAAGLLGTPSAAVSASCGVIAYYLMANVSANAPAISTMAAEDATAKIRLVIDGMIDNKTMIVMIAAFAITILAVYLIRRMSMDHSWTIAIIAGVMIELVILLVGDLLYDTNMSVLNAILGSALAVVVAKILELFCFCVDYNRTEKVQFEDDEYYYYVKAIPKMTVAAPTKTVKKINSKRKVEYDGYYEENGTRSRTGSRMTAEGRNSAERSRNVVTEHTGAIRGSSQRGTSRNYRNDYMNGKSVTIGSNTTDSGDDYGWASTDPDDDYEEF